MENSNKPIFPVYNKLGDLYKDDGSGGSHVTALDNLMTLNPLIGITKREYFAAMAMQGIIAGIPDIGKNGYYIPSEVYPLLMQQAHQLADELLKQLDKA